MFTMPENITIQKVVEEEPVYTNKFIPQTSTISSHMTSVNLDILLEKEKQNNKADSWNKLDKTVKTQALHSFAETYGKDKSLSAKDVKLLKLFFSECLKTNKLNKTKTEKKKIKKVLKNC